VRALERSAGAMVSRVVYDSKWVRQFGKDHLLNKIVRIEMKGEKTGSKSSKRR